MAQPDDEIDEVALNVLLAEGLDVPTAWEASRRHDGSESTALSCVGTVVLLVIAVVVIAILWLRQ